MLLYYSKYFPIYNSYVYKIIEEFWLKMMDLPYMSFFLLLLKIVLKEWNMF